MFIVTTRGIPKLFAINGDLVGLLAHKALIRQFLSISAFVEIEATLSCHCLAYALSVHLPVVLTLAPMILQHPFRGSEFGHKRQLQIVDLERRAVHGQQGPELDYIEGGREVATAFDLREDGHHGTQTGKRATFES